MHKIKNSHPDIKFYFCLLILYLSVLNGKNIVNELYIYELSERIALHYIYPYGQNKFPVM
jgi:hypothetical protein